MIARSFNGTNSGLEERFAGPGGAKVSGLQVHRFGTMMFDQEAPGYGDALPSNRRYPGRQA